jgi:hypothetical protein
MYNYSIWFKVEPVRVAEAKFDPGLCTVYDPLL